MPTSSRSPASLRACSSRRRHLFEMLEDRVPLAVDIMQSGGVLTILGDNDTDVITITERDRQGEYRIVASEGEGGDEDDSTAFTARGITSINLQLGGGNGSDVVNFVAESDQNSTGLNTSTPRALNISSSGISLTVTIGNNVDVSRGEVGIAFSGDNALNVNVIGVQDDGEEGVGSTGIRLGALTIVNTSGSANSTIVVGPEVRVRGGLTLDLGDGDDVVTIDGTNVSGILIARLDAGENDMTITSSTIGGNATIFSQEDGAAGSDAGDIDFAFEGTAINGTLNIDLRDSDQVGHIALESTSMRGGMGVVGGNQADIVTLSRVTTRGLVRLALNGGSGNSGAEAAAGSNVVVTDLSQLGGDLTVTGTRNTQIVVDGNSSVQGSVNISAPGGSDPSRLTVGSVAVIDDDTTLDVDETAAASGASIRGSVRYSAGSGTDTVAFTNATIGGEVILKLSGNTVDSEGQGSSITLTNSAVQGNLTQFPSINEGRLSYTQTASTRIGGSVSLNAAGSAEMTVLIESNSTIGGGLSVLSGSGFDTVSIDGSAGLVVIGGPVTLDLQDGPANVNLTTVDINGGFTLGVSVEEPTGGDEEDSTLLTLDEVHIAGALSVNTASAQDTLVFRDIIVDGTTTLNTGEENDLVDISNSDFAGAVTIDTGAGGDVVLLESEGASEGTGSLDGVDTVFRDLFSLSTGEGNDFVDLGSDEANEVVFFGLATLDGGGASDDNSEDDSINDDFAEFLASVTFDGFEQRS